MDNIEKEDKLNSILKDLFANFCHQCIETICGQALNSIYQLKIEPEKTATCYLMFLQEKILNIEIECKNRTRGCKDRIRFGELNHHLLECNSSTYNTLRIKNNDNLQINPFSIENNPQLKINSDLLPYSDLAISSSSSSIINKTISEDNNFKKINKKRKNKKF